MGQNWYGYVYKKNHNRFGEPKLLVPSIAKATALHSITMVNIILWVVVEVEVEVRHNLTTKDDISYSIYLDC